MNVLKDKEKIRETSIADHRFLGQQLDLFSIDEEVGIGLVLWHPKGTIIRRVIRDFWESEHLKNGYQLVCTPHIARRELWKISGHLSYYSENMYLFEKDHEPYVVKPMNCPFHIQIFNSKPRSYKELPIRYAEWGTVYRYERSGTLHGLMRVRGFTVDDAHIFCTREQVDEEIRKLLDLTRKLLQQFGFKEHRVYLSTRDPNQPAKYMGSPKEWKLAQEALANALDKKGIGYREMPGEAVFYGPKIDMNIVDASGREWQCTTIQFDFNLPKRFRIAYTGADGKRHRPVMIHRALLGAVERFLGVLTEHYRGNFPVWLAPVQAIVLPVGEEQIPYAKEAYERLQAHGIRSEIDLNASTVGYKVREAETQKIPYMLICGKREADLGKISVRRHSAGNIGVLTIEEFVKHLKSDPHN